MFNFVTKNFFTAAAVIVMVGVLSQAPASAQVVNSGAGTTSSNSQVTLTASVPSVVMVKVNQGTSTLSASINPNQIDASSNTVTQDFKIFGNVVVNNPNASVQCVVSTKSLNLTNGNDSIKVNLTGTIGGTNIHDQGFSPSFSNRQAAINILGDLDESTITSAKAPGNYSGTFTITATLL